MCPYLFRYGATGGEGGLHALLLLLHLAAEPNADASHGRKNSDTHDCQLRGQISQHPRASDNHQ